MSDGWWIHSCVCECVWYGRANERGAVARWRGNVTSASVYPASAPMTMASLIEIKAVSYCFLYALCNNRATLRRLAKVSNTDLIESKGRCGTKPMIKARCTHWTRHSAHPPLGGPPAHPAIYIVPSYYHTCAQEFQHFSRPIILTVWNLYCSLLGPVDIGPLLLLSVRPFISRLR